MRLLSYVHVHVSAYDGVVAAAVTAASAVASADVVGDICVAGDGDAGDCYYDVVVTAACVAVKSPPQLGSA